MITGGRAERYAIQVLVVGARVGALQVGVAITRCVVALLGVSR